jgi:hypothetical protein
MKKNLPLLSLVFVLFACKQDASTETITIKKLYSLEIPDFLSAANHLHEDASLQYQNIFKEFYTIVINEPSKDFNEMIVDEPSLSEYYTADLEGYSNLIIDNMKVTIEDGTFSEFTQTKINGNEARTISIDGTVENIKVFYHLTFIKGRRQYYQIVNWTELKRKEDHLQFMENISASFKELKQKK